MERESHQDPTPRLQGPPPDDGDSVEHVRAQAQEILNSVDNMLASIHVSDAEGFLQDNRQHGGQ